MPAADTARLIASLELKDLFSPQTAKIGKSLNTLDRQLDRTQGRAYLAGQQIGTGIKRGALLAASGVAILGTAFVGVFAKSLQAASDLSETVSKVGVVFGKQAAPVLAFGKTAAASLGLSEQAALSAAATYGNLFVSMGLAEDKSREMSLRLVTLAGDLASFNNIDPTEALDKLRAGLVGETEPLRTLGINLNDATLRQEALALGLTKTTKEVLPPAIKAQAAYSLILKQSKTAQGDFNRTSGGMANQVRILRANWENLKTTLATPTLPRVATIFKRINEEVIRNQGAIGKLGDEIAGLFTEANINQGFEILRGAFQTAKEAAPFLAAAAKTTFTIVQAAVGLFKSLPPEIQKLAVGAFAINKLTGGLVTNLAGGLISAVLKQLVSGVVNVTGATVIVNGAGVPGVPGAPIPLGPGPGQPAVTGFDLGKAVTAIVASAAANLEVADAAKASFSEARQKRFVELIKQGLSPTEALKQSLDEFRKGLIVETGALVQEVIASGDRTKDDTTDAIRNAAERQRDAIETLRIAMLSVKASIDTAAGGGRSSKATFAGFTPLGGAGAASGGGLPAGSGGVFVPTVTLDPSAVRDLRADTKTERAMMLAAWEKHLREISGRIFPGKEKDDVGIGTGRTPIYPELVKVNRNLVDLRAIEKSTSGRTDHHLSDLKSIEKSAGGRAAASARVIAQKLDATQRAARQAGQQAAAAIRDKDLSVRVTVPLTVRTSVNLRETLVATRTYFRVGNIPT